MRAVVQRASSGRVTVEGEEVGALDGPGLVVLVGVTHDDGPVQVATIAKKVATLRILAGEKSAVDLGAGVLLISQFTLYADTAKGRRPSWNQAAPGPVAQPLVESLAEVLRGEHGLKVATGRFGADMQVELVNDGPMTILIEA
ncbi:D-aminoacyl-tRNA deacylase [Kineosporia mesophila]|uniref:D-aminoacyl-tRNA deacylase n=1 Tax=Kineosporia mesophila TaxID=566012 RepID=A0ABP6ZB02_9ACTN|nr:D-tyrosyl-tRNA(Tyr) deacylase [Kineosporia mesophila]